MEELVHTGTSLPDSRMCDYIWPFCSYWY